MFMEHTPNADTRSQRAFVVRMRSARGHRLISWRMFAMQEVNVVLTMDCEPTTSTSDRTIAEYATEIWNAQPCPVD